MLNPVCVYLDDIFPFITLKCARRNVGEIVVAEVQFGELDEALEGVEGDVVEPVMAQPQLADNDKPPEGLLCQVGHHVSV